MSANVNYYSFVAWQADHTVQSWQWKLGDNRSYWGFSVRPQAANNWVQLQQIWTIADNFLQQTTWMTVSVQDAPPGSGTTKGGGGMLNFVAIGSS